MAAIASTGRISLISSSINTIKCFHSKDPFTIAAPSSNCMFASSVYVVEPLSIGGTISHKVWAPRISAAVAQEEVEMASIQLASSSQAQLVHISSGQFVSPSLQLTTSAAQARKVQIASPHSRSPSLHLIENKREYSEKCVPLYKLALRGDWNAAKRMIDADRRLLNAAITKENGTLLHVAAGANHVHFVDELVKLLNPQDLELLDCNENTPFCFAAASGNLQIALIIMDKNDCLPLIKGGKKK